MLSKRITVPDDISFNDLDLTRDVSTGAVTFRWEPLERICAVSGVDVALLKERSEDNVGGLLVAWYAAHRKAGGAANDVAEQLIAEVQAEDRYGEAHVQRGSVKPQ